MKTLNIIILLCSQILLAQTASKTRLLSESESLLEISQSQLVETFLKGVKQLKNAPSKTIIYHDKKNNKAYSEEEFQDLNKDKSSELKKKNLNDTYFYYTKFGTPLAFVAPLEILAKYDFEISKETKIVDFGFGSIGHLSLLSHMGAKVTGIEVDPILEVLYQKFDTNLNLVYGLFPKNKNVVTDVEKGYDLFISKNTLKKGFISPESGKNPIIDFEVSDEYFLQSIYDLLKPGGYMFIYNLHGSYEKDPKPWKDGRSPYDIELYKKVGFKVLEYNTDHTNYARKMGVLLKWDETMNFENDLFATYTLLKK